MTHMTHMTHMTDMTEAILDTPAGPSPQDWQISPAQMSRESVDPLLGCLMALVRFYGRSLSPSVLIAGLPLVDNRLTPQLFLRAADRAGLCRPG